MNQQKINFTKIKNQYIYSICSLFQCCAPILKSLTLENCQDECDSHSQCYSWSYHITSKKCYLKNQENYQNFVLRERYTKQDEYISGVKHCDPMEEEISRNNNNLRVFIHGHQLKALYANFGRQIHPGIKVSMNFFCGLIQREICIKTGSTLRLEIRLKIFGTFY